MNELEYTDIPNILELSLTIPVLQIAEKYDVDPAILNRFLTRHGITLLTYRKQVRKDTVLAIINEGGTIHDAAEKLGLSTKTTYNLIRGCHLPKRYKNEFVVMQVLNGYAIKKDSKKCTDKIIGRENFFTLSESAQSYCDELNIKHQVGR
jgi:hypothetical protein